MNVNFITASQARGVENGADAFGARAKKVFVCSFAISAMAHAVLLFAIAGENVAAAGLPAGSLLVRLVTGTGGENFGSGESGVPRAGGVASADAGRARPSLAGREGESSAAAEEAAHADDHAPQKAPPPRARAAAAPDRGHARDQQATSAASSAPVAARRSTAGAGPDPEAEGPIGGLPGVDGTQLASAGSGPGEWSRSSGGLSGSSGGGFGFGRDARGSYEQQLAAWLERYKQYPDLARRRGLEGTASLRVAIRRDGSVISAALQGPSHHDVLDRAALDLIRRAQPFPPMPGELAGEHFEFVVPIRFHLDQRG